MSHIYNLNHIFDILLVRTQKLSLPLKTYTYIIVAEIQPHSMLFIILIFHRCKIYSLAFLYKIMSCLNIPLMDFHYPFELEMCKIVILNLLNFDTLLNHVI